MTTPALKTRCITKGCGKFVYPHALWCRECDPEAIDCRALQCAPCGGVCCYTADALELLGIDPWSDGMTWREQYESTTSRPQEPLSRLPARH